LKNLIALLSLLFNCIQQPLLADPADSLRMELAIVREQRDTLAVVERILREWQRAEIARTDSIVNNLLGKKGCKK
jgi:hypothetical protein